MTQEIYNLKLRLVKEALMKFTDPKPEYDGMTAQEVARYIMMTLFPGEDKTTN